MKNTITAKLYCLCVAIGMLLVTQAPAQAQGGDEGGGEKTEEPKAIYLAHPDDKNAKQGNGPDSSDAPAMARALARGFLTPKLALKHEPVDVFYFPESKVGKFPENCGLQLLKSYSERREWKQSIGLKVENTLLDLKQPHKVIADSAQLRKTIEAKTELATFVQFGNLILGDDSDSLEAKAAMTKSVMQAFFSKKCQQTMILEVSDGAQQQGFLLAALIEKEKEKFDLVGLLIVWD